MSKDNRLYLFIASCLCIHYILYVIFMRFLTKRLNLKTLILNLYLITAIILLFIFPKDILIKPCIDHILLFLLSFIIMLGAICWYSATKMKLNLGKLDGLAIAFYLPILSLISVIFFRDKISNINLFGIFIIGIGAYLTLY